MNKIFLCISETAYQNNYALCDQNIKQNIVLNLYEYNFKMLDLFFNQYSNTLWYYEMVSGT